MVLKTRDKLIEVARQLFATKGEENTTMNDIAVASEKGRRTIYTYFKNKREIPPEQKLMNFIFIRFETIKELVYRNGSLRAGFFRDIRKVDRARKATVGKEVSILKQILAEGVEKGVFRIRHIEETATVMILALQGMDVPYVRDSFSELGIEKLKLREYIKDFIMHGIGIYQ